MSAVRCCAVAASLIVVLCVSDCARSDEPLSRLIWSNGDRLSGRLLAVENGEVQWGSPLFRNPLHITVDVLNAMEFLRLPPDEPIATEYRIELSNGDILRGDLVEAADETLRFHGPELGDFELPRSEVRRAVRIAADHTIYEGPNGLSEWQAQNSENPLSNFSETVDGRISTSVRDAGLFLPQSLPERAVIEFRMSSSRRCSFTLGLRNTLRGLRLETWDNVLVATRGLEFQEVLTLGDSDHECHLVLYVDLAAGVLTACLPEGRTLEEFRFQDEEQQNTGISIGSRDSDLTLDYLRMSHWNGVLPDVGDSTDARVILDDGSVVAGSVLPFGNAEQQVLIDAGTGEPVRVAKQRIREIRHPVPTKVIRPASVRVRTLRGCRLSADSVETQDGFLVMSREPPGNTLQVQLPHVSQMQFLSPNRPGTATDTLSFADQSLHGTLAIREGVPGPLQWLPAGAQSPVALSGDGNAVLRRAAAVSEPVDTHASPHVIHLVGGDTLPCRVLEADADSVHVISQFCEQASIPFDQVAAVEFHGAAILRQTQFAPGDRDTHLAEMNAPANRATLQPGGVIRALPSIVSDTLQFRFDWKENSLSAIGIYCTTADWQGAQPDFCVVARPMQVAVSPDMTSLSTASVRLPVEEAGPGHTNPVVIAKSVTSAMISVATTGSALEVRINGVLALTRQLETPLPAFRGFAVKDLGLGVAPRARVVDGIVSPSSSFAIEVSGFEVATGSSLTTRFAWSVDSRRMAATIPRFRRDDPPSHVVLAPNGDLLRGRLVRWSAETTVFESRLEEIRIPSERVLAVIRLSAPESDTPQRIAGLVRVRLGNGYSVSLVPEIAERGRLVGHSPVLGICHIPADEVSEIVVGHESHSAAAMTRPDWELIPARDPDWQQQSP